MNSLSQPIVESVIEASNLALQLKDSFEFFSLLHQPSHIGTQHPVVGASVGGPINIGEYFYNYGLMLVLEFQYTFMIYAFSGLFLIPVTLI